MKSRNLVIILCFSSLLTLIITVALYTYQFGSINLSDKEQDWVSFSDYFSGILEPILALLNLIILTYLTIKLVKIEDDRNTWTLQELARPYANLVFENTEYSIDISIQNLGLGPMVMTDFKLFNDSTPPDTTQYDFPCVEKTFFPLKITKSEI